MRPKPDARGHEIVSAKRPFPACGKLMSIFRISLRRFCCPIKVSARMSKLSLVVLFAIIGFPVQQTCAQQPSVEATTVAKEVHSHTAWVSEADMCPSEIMPKSEALYRVPRIRCSKGEFNSCLSKCEDAEAGACYGLAQSLLQEGASRPAAEVLYQQACKLGIASGCTNRAAGMLKQRQDDPRTQACAAETFAKACSLDDPWACTMYALHLSRGLGVKRDPDLALKVLGKSCKNGPQDDACKAGMNLQKQLLEEGAKQEPN